VCAAGRTVLSKSDAIVYDPLTSMTSPSCAKIALSTHFAFPRIIGMGPRGFKSRSFQSFQEALEKGEAGHMMPMFNSKAKLKSGEIKMEDIPYMQRGGSWDNSDVKGAKKVKWLGSDKDYAGGGFKKEQSVSVWGYGEGLDWTGSRSKQGPEGEMRQAPKFARNYKAPNVKTMKKAPNVKSMKGAKAKPSSTEEKPKRKLFGLF
jgi:hypothetical protein